jgi:predicted ArsR family transcriptional regulator
VNRSTTLEAGREPLTDRQAEIQAIVQVVYQATGEAVAARYVARRLKIHHEAVRGHFAALHRKGFLVSETSPATPTRWLERR